MAFGLGTAAQGMLRLDDNLLPGRFSYAGGAMIQVAEGTRDVTVDKIYPGLPGSVPNTYAISGGADAALFAIDPTNGYLVFIDAPDYEAPRDLGAGAGNNTYEVEVTQRTATTIASQMLTVRVLDVDERPSGAPQTSQMGYRQVEVRYVAEADGTQRQLLTIGTQFVSMENGQAAIPVVADSNGKTLLSAKIAYDSGGLTASGSAAPKAAGASLGDMLREIGQHTEAGSDARAALSDGAARFLAGVAADTPILLQTIVPVAAFGESYSSRIELASTPADGASPLSALVIDARGLAGVTIMADDISFLALAGNITLNPFSGPGAGAQQVWADDAAQTLNLGAGNDTVHAGGGADTIFGGSGDDNLFGDDGDDLLVGGPGNDWIDGGAGLDTVRLEGARGDYVIRVEDGHFVVTARRTGDAVDELGNVTPPEGSDRIANVELLNFSGAGLDESSRGTVLRMIDALEGRVATRIELDGWEAELAAGTSLLDISTALLARYGGDDALSDHDFIQSLHLNGIGQPANLKELGWWTGWLNASTRADILLDFAEWGPTLIHARASGATTYIADTEIGSLVRMYDALFDRAPDAAGLNYWIGAFEGGNSIAAIANAFVNTAEGGINGMSDAQLIAHLYQAGLERTARADEIAGWLKLMDDANLTRGDLLLGIADSAEMTTLVGMMSTSIDLA